MSREQQGVVLFLSLFLCLLFFLTHPSSSLKEGGKAQVAGELLALPSGGQGIVLEMDGEVGPRGVLQAESGMTVREALKKTGGVHDQLSFPEEILSQKIEKSSRISIVPEGEGKGRVVIEPMAPARLKVLSVPIPLNTATAEELDTLPGIGPKTAQAIVEFREQKGKFASPEDLLQVPGIGPRKLAALLPHIIVR
ncbi:MAG: helix-hairpin-helix domain-containing protein [Deltaproteobacteria bacterium]|nr:helix-hairpin-helix domain-containing protein [Deltaproteobacteria bacterium]